MRHRGPDDEGLEMFSAQSPAGTSLGVANCRLAILDLSPKGHQPMQDTETGNWIVFNGEIYNYRALRGEMESRGHQFVSHSDTEVVLKSYAAEGACCVRKLRGIFAFAIWDARKQRLFLARDHLGIKPLYYSARPGFLAFSSELRALLASGLIERRLSWEGVYSYLALGAVQEPYTMVQGTWAFPPAHCGYWRGEDLRLERYWELPAEIDPAMALLPPREIRNHLRMLLEESVRLQLVSDAPLGAFLSGGIDSGGVVALVSRASSRPPRTVSIIFPERDFSEQQGMHRVAERYATEHTEVLLTGEALLRELPGAVAAMDQPTFDGINTYIVAKYARQTGLKVALSGLGGDELFAGYPSFAWAARLEQARKVAPEPIAAAVAWLLSGVTPHSDRTHKLARWFGRRDLDGDSYLLIRELLTPQERRQLFPTPFNMLGTKGCLGTGCTVSSHSDHLNWVSRCELSHYMKNVLLRDTDCMSMAHGLEVRVPLLDHRLVEFVLQLSGSWKRRGRAAKPLLVGALDELMLPGPHLRRKQGFALPFARWLTGPLRAEVESVLMDHASGGLFAGELDHDAARSLWKRFLLGQTHWTRPWALYALLRWAEKHVS